MGTDEQFHVDAVLPAYWRVTFDNGPVNLLDRTPSNNLALIERIDEDPDLAVVVFRRDKPGVRCPRCGRDHRPDDDEVVGDEVRVGRREERDRRGYVLRPPERASTSRPCSFPARLPPIGSM
jgi:hypothetical protein